MVGEGDGGALAVQLACASLSVQALGWQGVSVAFDGSLARPKASQFLLSGSLQLNGAPGGALRDASIRVAFDAAGKELSVELEGQGATRLGIRTAGVSEATWNVRLDAVPASWLAGALRELWSEGNLQSGTIGADASVHLQDRDMRSSGSFDIRELAFDSKSGTMAGEGIAARGVWEQQGDSATQNVQLDLTLNGGAVLLGPMFAALPDHPAQLLLDASLLENGSATIAVTFDDSDALGLQGDMAFDPAGELDSLRLLSLHANLPAAYQRYASSTLATHGFAELTTSGQLDVSLRFDDGLEALKLVTEQISIRDAGDRIDIRGLDGALDWQKNSDRPASTLAWQRFGLLGLPFGAATSHWQTRDGRLQLTAPVNLPLFDGNLLLQRLAWEPFAEKDAAALDLGLVLMGMDLRAVCRAFGWPEFGGTLAGAVPGLRYRDGRIDLLGGLSMQVFDGFVDVTSLSLSEPFGSAPVLTADIAMQDLDLALVTGVFDFGSITGRLDGGIRDLVTIDWRPVAFDAGFQTDGSGRISQRAVNSLSSLGGGGGIAGGIQGAMLGMFDTFGYSRIGLNCLLANEVCRMGGLEPVADGGYLIVDGRGLPHIEVIGHRREVDWPTLVARLAEVTSGASAPRIE